MIFKMGWLKLMCIKVMFVIDVMFFVLEFIVGFMVGLLVLMVDVFYMVFIVLLFGLFFLLLIICQLNDIILLFVGLWVVFVVVKVIINRFLYGVSFVLFSVIIFVLEICVID